MTPRRRHAAHHGTERIGRLRAAVPRGNDGIVSTVRLFTRALSMASSDRPSAGAAPVLGSPPLARPAAAREQSPAEEAANSLSHGLALLAALVGGPYLIVQMARRTDAAVVVGTCVFFASIVVLYLVSTVYHALPAGPAKRVFRVLDHASIYLLIAGSYTPFTLGVLRGPWGWSLFGVVWGLAAVGIALKPFDNHDRPILSTGLYLLMGWLVVVAIVPMVARVPVPGLLWLLAGGLFYTVGVAFYAADSRLVLGHLVWHLFVAAGTTCHYVAVLGFAA